RDFEVARGKNLPGEADIGHRRRVAVAEPAGLALLRKMRFERFEPEQRPMVQPVVARSFVQMHVAFQKIADAWHDERMRVAGDDERESAHSRAATRVAWQQWRLRMRLLQILEDGERLEERRSVVHD